MFTKTSRTDQARAQAAELTSTLGDTWRGKVAPVVGAKARHAAHWAAPHVERGRDAAAPKVGAAVEKVSPAIEAAREKLDDLLPRIVEAVSAAASAGAAAGVAAGEARSRGGDAVAVLKGQAVAKRKRGWLRKLLLLPIVAAAAAAGYSAFKSRQPKDDPWAVPTGTYPAYTPPAPAATPPNPMPPDTAPGAPPNTGADAAGSTLEDGEPSEAASTSPQPPDPAGKF